MVTGDDRTHLGEEIVKTKWMARAVAAALSLGFLPGVAGATQLMNAAGYRFLDTNGVAGDNQQVRVWSWADHPNQKWSVRYVRQNYFRLVNDTTGYCLDTDGTPVNGALVRQWSCVDHPNQLWEIMEVDDGAYRLRNASSGFCLDTDGAQTDGAIVRVWECVEHPNQQWYIFWN